MRRNCLLAVITLLALSAASAARGDDIFRGTLRGDAVNPPNTSLGLGSFAARYIAVSEQLRVELSFSGLSASATAAHIHCCATQPTNATTAINFPTFPAATEGSYQHLFNLASAATYGATFLANSGGTAAGAEAALLAGLRTGQAYVQVHSASFPGGEIRAYPIASLFVDNFERGDLVDWSAACGEPWVNETGLAREADFCVLVTPSSITVSKGSPLPAVIGELLEIGVTEPAGPAPGIRGQLGIGPSASDPRTSCAWRWERGEFFTQNGGYDVHVALATAPSASGLYSYAYRFSLDGAGWTACDLDGAGSLGGLDFSPFALGLLAVNP